ncbi:MAG: MFS transporter [Candidatus Hodarchaeales archaeon]|jgi:MFS family permease
MQSQIQSQMQSQICLGRLEFAAVFFLHFIVAMFLVALGSVVPFELSAAGWKAALIAILFGFITLMELGRIIFARVVEKKGLQYSLHVYLLGISLVTGGSAVLALNEIQGQFFILISIFAASFGTAITTTVMDGLLAKNSQNQDSQLSTSLQAGRLSGFALGGIGIAVLYGNSGSQLIFFVITVILIGVGLLGSLSVVKIANKYKQALPGASEPEEPSSFLMLPHLDPAIKRELLIFLLFYSFFGIGFFAQDSILEVFGREKLSFGRTEVGRLTGVWGTATLLGVLVSGYLLHKYSDKLIISISSCVAAAGIFLVSLATSLDELTPFAIVAIGVFLLGIGGGAVSTPAITRLVHYSKRSPIPLTIMGLFGIASALIRSGSSFMAALVISLFSFETLFVFEAGCLIVALMLFLLLPAKDENSSPTAKI